MINTIKEGISITRNFGLSYAIKRYKDFRLREIDEKRRDKLYKILKPKTSKVVRIILGNKIILDMNDYGINRDLFLDGIREPFSTGYLMNFLTKKDITLDIGANIGYYALIESRICKKVYAVEPVHEIFESLNANIKLNNFKNIETFQFAFGNKIGNITININRKCNLNSIYPIKNTIGKQNTEINTIDNFLKNKTKPSFVRMDVEGYELNIVKGMINTLPKLKMVFIELHSHIMKLNETRELLDILKKNNFEPDLIVQYDRPGLNKILPNNYINRIYQGERGGYEIFFKNNKN